MRIKLSMFVALMVFIFGSNLFAKDVTVADIKSSKVLDGDIVTVKGKITKRSTRDKDDYMFQDSTGTIKVEIELGNQYKNNKNNSKPKLIVYKGDTKEVLNLPLSFDFTGTNVKIEAEVDKGFVEATDLDARRIRLYTAVKASVLADDF